MADKMISILILECWYQAEIYIMQWGKVIVLLVLVPEGATQDTGTKHTRNTGIVQHFHYEKWHNLLTKNVPLH